MKHAPAILALLFAGALSAAAFAQSSTMQSPMPNPPGPSGPAPSKTQPDAASERSTATEIPSRFAHQVASSDQFEIQAGKLAQQRSQNDQICAFGAMMVTDHTASTNKLFDAMAAAKLEPALPSKPDESLRQAIDRLRKLSGTDFDQAYIKSQIAGHEQMVTLLHNYSETGNTPALRSFAAQTLPTVQMHLRKAQAIAHVLHVS
jgi:putative membrane protein